MTQGVRLSNGTISRVAFAPEDARIERAPLNVVTGGDPEENAGRLRALLGGRGSQAEIDIVLLNAAALLHTAGKAADLREGAGLARDALLSSARAPVPDDPIARLASGAGVHDEAQPRGGDC